MLAFNHLQVKWISILLKISMMLLYLVVPLPKLQWQNDRTLVLLGMTTAIKNPSHGVMAIIQARSFHFFLSFRCRCEGAWIGVGMKSAFYLITKLLVRAKTYLPKTILISAKKWIVALSSHLRPSSSFLPLSFSIILILPLCSCFLFSISYLLQPYIILILC